MVISANCHLQAIAGSTLQGQHLASLYIVIGLCLSYHTLGDESNLNILTVWYSPDTSFATQHPLAMFEDISSPFTGILGFCPDWKVTASLVNCKFRGHSLLYKPFFYL